MIFANNGFVGGHRHQQAYAAGHHLPVQPRVLGPRKEIQMASKASPARREGLLREARKVIARHPEVFTRAGHRLAEIYTEKHLHEHDKSGKWKGRPSRELLFPRLDAARLGAINDNYPVDQTDMRFEEPMSKEDRQLGASMVVLTLVLSIDPTANDYVSEEMCPFAALPWDAGDDAPGLLGRDMFCWQPNEVDGNSLNSPPGEVLDLLEEAKWSASSGDVKPEGITIPTGDAQPDNEPGINPIDELWRSLRNVNRHVLMFQGIANDWSDTYKYPLEHDQQEREQIKVYNRQCWDEWERSMPRARDAVIEADLASIKIDHEPIMDAIAELRSIFCPPRALNKNEKIGDHLLVRGAAPMGCDRKGVSRFPIAGVNKAYRAIDRAITRLNQYMLDLTYEGPVVELKPAKTKSKRPRRSKADRVEDESKILKYLEENPNAKRDEIADATGIAKATVSASPSWMSRKTMESRARAAGRAQGVGGVGDPSVDYFDGDS
tara:strand:+ start:75046 stop:76521 length:1476 start_codon:yes stop_codon:yes gene_type:complete